jgi:hypothetical protein
MLIGNYTGIARLAEAMQTSGSVINMAGEAERWGVLHKAQRDLMIL